MGEASDEQSGGWGFDTRAVHAGQQPDPATGAVVTPISLSTTFAQDGVGGHKGFEYSRSGNPTRAALEACVASLSSEARTSPAPWSWRTRSGARYAPPVRTRWTCPSSTPDTTRPDDLV